MRHEFSAKAVTRHGRRNYLIQVIDATRHQTVNISKNEYEHVDRNTLEIMTLHDRRADRVPKGTRKVKLERAQGGCLGTKSRRKT